MDTYSFVDIFSFSFHEPSDNDWISGVEVNYKLAWHLREAHPHVQPRSETFVHHT